jgi:hypothetical protein
MAIDINGNNIPSVVPCFNSTNMLITDSYRQAAYLCFHVIMAAANESTYFDTDRASLRTILSQHEYSPELVKNSLQTELNLIFNRYFTNNEVKPSVSYEVISDRQYRLVITLFGKYPEDLISVIGEFYLNINTESKETTGTFEHQHFSF